jgi:predicted dehydrogenase
MIKVGLLGAGRIAGVHATAITSNPLSTLAAVSDYYIENAENWQRSMVRLRAPQMKLLLIQKSMSC